MVEYVGKSSRFPAGLTISKTSTFVSSSMVKATRRSLEKASST